ncbi:MAG: hypothetical protein K1X92_16175 [Bacteroidia bacterium]|nr:hypothetical protein [Bacteroidia bacterium]
MRKLVFSFLFIAGVASSVFAQAPVDRVKPVAGDMGIGFKLTGIANVSFNDWDANHFNVPQLLYRYYVSDKFAIRTGLGLDLMNTKGTFFDEEQIGAIKTTTDSDSSMTGMGFGISPGFEFHLASPAAKVDPYVGVVVGVSYLGTSEYQRRDKVDVFDFNTGQYTSQSDITVRERTPGGLGFGGNALIGFNYFFSDNFALGAEYMLGYQMVNTGGEYETSVNGFTGTPGNVVPINTVTNYTGTSSSGNGAIRSTGGVNVSVFW